MDSFSFSFQRRVFAENHLASIMCLSSLTERIPTNVNSYV